MMGFRPSCVRHVSEVKDSYRHGNIDLHAYATMKHLQIRCRLLHKVQMLPYVANADADEYAGATM